MIEKNLEYIYNLDYLILVPSVDIELFDGFSNTFKNVLLFQNNYEDIEFFKKFIKKNNVKRLIFVDYILEYDYFINLNIKKDFIFTKSLGSLSDSPIFLTFNKIISFYQNNLIEKIGILDEDLYLTLEKKYNVYKLNLLLNNSEYKVNNSTIGILNSQDDPKDSFYNSLSAISILKNKTVKILNPNKITKAFVKTFNINLKKAKDKNDLYKNDINLYINFTYSNLLPFFKSFEYGVPCLIGNTTLLDNYPKLKKYLVVKSDDNIDEIAEQIKIVQKNKEEILNLYKNFELDYEKETYSLKEKFLGLSEFQKEVSYEKLISVIVPIYNVEKYLSKSLDSIIAAKIDDMEILLINDGSTDSSDQIAKEYASNYPDLIRYIYQTNHGLGNVRNVGLKESKGKYIASIDSDDTININFFKEALPYIKNDIDMVIYDWQSITEKESFPTPALDTMIDVDSDYKKLLYATIMPSACNKIVKKELYSDIKFAEGKKFEDLSTNPIIILKSNKIKYINKSYYEYMIRPGSIMRTSAGKDMIDIIEMLNDRLLKILPKGDNNYIEFINYIYWWRIEELFFNQIYNLNDKELKEYCVYYYLKINDISNLLFQNNTYVNNVINQFDKETKDYIIKRNKAIIDKKLYTYVKKAIKEKEYKIITAAMILYNIDNR